MFNSKFSNKNFKGEKVEVIELENKNFLVEHSLFRCTKNSPFNFSSHLHPEMEICIITNGTFEAKINNVAYVLESGDAYVAQPMISHSLKNISEKGAFYNLIFEYSLLSSRFIDSCELKYLIPLQSKALSVNGVIRNDKEFNGLIKKIINEKEKKEEGYELKIKGYMFLLLAIIINHSKSASVSENIYADKFNSVKRALKFVEENFTDDITLSQVTSKFKISKQRFCMLFKELTGKTFVEYINFMRVNEALPLLELYGKNITEIATQVGFNELNYFSRIFKKYFKISPQEYRTKIQLSK